MQGFSRHGRLVAREEWLAGEGDQLLTLAKEELTLTLNLLGTQRNIQRRDSCRIDLHSKARYRDLVVTADSSREWKIAELCDVSLGGASMLLQNEAIDVGHKLLVELTLDRTIFSVPAVVCRLVRGDRGNPYLYALRYLDFDTPQQDRMAKAIVHLQLKLISTRVSVD